MKSTIKHFVAVYSSKVSSKRYAFHLTGEELTQTGDCISHIYETFIDIELALHTIKTSDESFDSIKKISSFFKDVTDYSEIDDFKKKIQEDYAKKNFISSDVQVTHNYLKNKIKMKNREIVHKNQDMFRKKTHEKAHEQSLSMDDWGHWVSQTTGKISLMYKSA